MRSRPPARRGASRTLFVLCLAVLGLLVFAVLFAARRAEMSGRATAVGSSFRADETGHRAARLLLEELGMTVHSRRRARYPDGIGHVLIREEGLPGSDAEELPERERATAGADLLRWIERGNAALVFASRTPPGEGWPTVRERFELETEGEDVAGPAIPDIEDGDPLDIVFGPRPDVPEGGGGVREEHEFDELSDPWITPYHVIELAAEHGTDEVLVARVTDEGEREPVIVRARRGRGEMIVVADPWFATNVRLARGDNAAWLATLVRDVAAGGDVWFDDRALGQVASRGVLSLFDEAGLGPAMAAMLLLLLLLWWRVGPSDAPDRITRPQDRYRPSAYAELRAGLYADCLTADEVRTMVRSEIARRISHGDGVPYERALSMLDTRDPTRAAALRAAVEALPSHARVTVTRHAPTWCAAVSRVWAALDTEPNIAARDGDAGTDERGTDDGE